MRNGKWKMEKFTRGGFRALLFIVINQWFVTGNLLSCSRSLQTLVHDTRPTFPFPFPFFFPLLSPSFFLSFCRNNLFAIEDARGGKKRGGLNLKKVGQKDGNEVNGLTKEKRKSMEIS